METFEKKKIKTMKKEVDRFFRKDIEITFFVNSNQPSFFQNISGKFSKISKSSICQNFESES